MSESAHVFVGDRLVLLDFPEGDEKHMAYIIEETYIFDIYKDLDVKGRQVLDLGAYCGETAIYFSLRGASEVWAVEPLNFKEYADKNFVQNEIMNVIWRKGAVAGKPGTLDIKEKEGEHDVYRLKEFSTSGESVRVYTLHELIEDMKLNDAVLKMDIEWMEKEVIYACTREDLRHFESMAIEYSYEHATDGEGEQKFMNYIADCGFKVHTVTTPQQVHLIYAERIDVE